MAAGVLYLFRETTARLDFQLLARITGDGPMGDERFTIMREQAGVRKAS